MKCQRCKKDLSRMGEKRLYKTYCSPRCKNEFVTYGVRKPRKRPSQRSMLLLIRKEKRDNAPDIKI